MSMLIQCQWLNQHFSDILLTNSSDYSRWLIYQLRILRNSTRSQSPLIHQALAVHCYRHRIIGNISFTVSLLKIHNHTLYILAFCFIQLYTNSLHTLKIFWNVRNFLFHFPTRLRPESICQDSPPSLAAAASLTLCGFQGRPGLPGLTHELTPTWKTQHQLKLLVFRCQDLTDRARNQTTLRPIRMLLYRLVTNRRGACVHLWVSSQVTDRPRPSNQRGSRPQ